MPGWWFATELTTNVWVQAEPLEPLTDRARARVRVRLTLDSDEPRAAAVSCAVCPPTFTGETEQGFDFAFDVPQGRSQHDLGFVLAAARLWQPWERGEPCLYELAVSLRAGEAAHSQTNDPALLDVFTTRFGVRKIERQRTDRGHPWRMVVNGHPLFLRGANWVPVDAYGSGQAPPLRSSAAPRPAGRGQLPALGGGGREKRAFYDLCDELGLLVWQEFPIAGVFLDHLPWTDRFRRLLHQEATGIVQAPAIAPASFCGAVATSLAPGATGQPSPS